MWHSQTQSIFFFDFEGRLMEAKVSLEPTFSVLGRPRVVLDGNWGGVNREQIEITPDGERFLLMKLPPQEDITELVVVENWFEELKRKAPPAR